jgi:nitronate monooxygenase
MGGWQKISTHDGRAIVNDTLREYASGVSEEELKKKYAVATKEGDYSRLVVYAGTGSGLITKKQTVKEILDEIEGQLAEEVKSLNARLGGH